LSLAPFCAEGGQNFARNWRDSLASARENADNRRPELEKE
jgi:hypothetical protein